MEREQALARLRDLEERTDKLAQAVRRGAVGLRQSQELRVAWERLAAEDKNPSSRWSIASERRNSQRAIRGKIVSGEYPLMIAEVISGADADIIWLLCLDLYWLTRQYGVPLEDVTRNHVQKILRRVPTHALGDPGSVGYIAGLWVSKKPPYGGTVEERRAFLDSYPRHPREIPEVVERPERKALAEDIGSHVETALKNSIDHAARTLVTGAVAAAFGAGFLAIMKGGGVQRR